jgi:SAM-dependent methyltransferase
VTDAGRDLLGLWLEHRSVWSTKPVLRSIYTDFYRRVAEWLVPGPTVELGSGSGNFKDFLPASLAVDVRPAPWLDAVADAHRLPFADTSLSNIVLIDVIHHLAEPRRFLAEAERVLAPLGRIVLVEPAITPLSWVFYRFFHPERIDFSADPLTQVDKRTKFDPYDGNQAIPTLLFDNDAERLRAEMPLLRIRHKSPLSLFAYPLSGGFRRWSLVPEAAAAPLLRIEDRLLPALGKWMAFRMFVVMERITAPEVAPH